MLVSTPRRGANRHPPTSKASYKPLYNRLFMYGSIKLLNKNK